MPKRILMILFALVGASIGGTFLPYFWQLVGFNGVVWLDNVFTNSILGALIFFLISLMIVEPVLRGIKRIEKQLADLSMGSLLFGSIGTIIGLLLGALISLPFYQLRIPFLNNVFPGLLIVLAGYLGLRMGSTRTDDLLKLFGGRKKEKAAQGEMLERRADDNFHKFKILDTSVIIDGRIYDIAKTGFLEGVLLVPKFVLYELQYIADSGDSLKRVRGRRGLDILNALQKEDDIHMEMYEGDFEDIAEVDAKLLKLAKLLDGVVVTNDYNLNKVAEFQHVPVLNINALANAVKPVVIPGETMTVQVVKDGTERQQGVAYLDDGTMVVVEDGHYFMNQRLEVVVTSALQTAAGRMIFAKPAHAQKNIKDSQKSSPKGISHAAK
ncbi:MAG: PIN/TRAM domain-containing protein [Enterococcaceae bacterium]|jgi:uncharacterized protein YacL|nr:PIN/TRAM domain-containing protein [Enterococcaceae bacterium]